MALRQWRSTAFCPLRERRCMWVFFPSNWRPAFPPASSRSSRIRLLWTGNRTRSIPPASGSPRPSRPPPHSRLLACFALVAAILLFKDPQLKPPHSPSPPPGRPALPPSAVPLLPLSRSAVSPLHDPSLLHQARRAPQFASWRFCSWRWSLARSSSGEFLSFSLPPARLHNPFGFLALRSRRAAKERAARRMSP
jgi:hypothetical protein